MNNDKAESPTWLFSAREKDVIKILINTLQSAQLRIDRLTNGFVTDIPERNKAMETYHEIREVLHWAKVFPLTTDSEKPLDRILREEWQFAESQYLRRIKELEADVDRLNNYVIDGYRTLNENLRSDNERHFLKINELQRENDRLVALTHPEYGELVRELTAERGTTQRLDRHIAKLEQELDAALAGASIEAKRGDELFDKLQVATEALEGCTGGDNYSGEGIYKTEIARKALEEIEK